LVGTNNTKLLVVGTATEAVINVFFDYTLIYGKWGLPEMGFNGAAFASIIAEFAGLVVIFWVIRSKGVSGQLQLFSNFRWHADNTRKILIISAPLVMQHAISIITWEFFYILVEHHGNRDLAISNTMRNIFGFFGCFTWAFAATTTTMVSNVIGQGLEEKVPELLRRIMFWSVGFAIAVCLFLNIAPALFLSVYGQGDDFIQAAIPVLRVVSFALVVMSFSVVWMNAVTGSGHSKMTLLAEVIAIVLYSVYVYTTLEYLNLSITWGWMSEWVYWLSIFVPCFWFMQSGKWKNKSI
jgi:Na+-driven multidrug efflux pump